MKISTDHLEKVRTLLTTSTEQLADQAKVSQVATEHKAALDSQTRSLQGAFDICAAAYAQASDLSESQINDLPPAAQEALGYSKAV
jgi:hypothetical protein